MRAILLLLAVSAFLVPVCLAAPADQAGPDLMAMMCGSFSSAAQAAADTNYFDIRLEMVRIWPEHPDGFWLYVEQAAADHLDRPYRQRVYHVTRAGDDLFRSEVYALRAPGLQIGAWRQEQPLAALSPDSLEVRAGCAVFLRRTPGGAFAGSTNDKDCTSGLRGATYATSDVQIEADRITSWDRGFDAGGGQVWGAELGPYIFLRAGQGPELPVSAATSD